MDNSTCFRGTFRRWFLVFAALAALVLFILEYSIEMEEQFELGVFDPYVPQTKPPFDIDIVYSWAGPSEESTNTDARTRDNRELLYSLRSIFMFAPWYSKIWIIVPDAVYAQVKSEPNSHFAYFQSEKVLNQHRVFFYPQSDLFTIKEYGIDNHNSNAIEVNMDNLIGLAEHFIYFCDDFFLGRPAPWQSFFNPDNIAQPRLWIEKWKLIHEVGVEEPYIYGLPESFKGMPAPSHIKKYVAHTPRPLTKTLLRELKSEYPEWVNFVSSHKSRYCGENPDPGTKCNRQETLWLSWWWWTMQKDLQGKPVLNLIEDPDHLWHVYFVKKDWYWPADNLRRHLSDVLCERPYSFSINDKFNSVDKYEAQQKELVYFYGTYFPLPSPIEVTLPN